MVQPDVPPMPGRGHPRSGVAGADRAGTAFANRSGGVAQEHSMNKVATTTWVSVAILAAIILIAFLATRGGF